MRRLLNVRCASVPAYREPDSLRAELQVTVYTYSPETLQAGDKGSGAAPLSTASYLCGWRAGSVSLCVHNRELDLTVSHDHLANVLV